MKSQYRTESDSHKSVTAVPRSNLASHVLGLSSPPCPWFLRPQQLTSVPALRLKLTGARLHLTGNSGLFPSIALGSMIYLLRERFSDPSVASSLVGQDPYKKSAPTRSCATDCPRTNICHFTRSRVFSAELIMPYLRVNWRSFSVHRCHLFRTSSLHLHGACSYCCRCTHGSSQKVYADGTHMALAHVCARILDVGIWAVHFGIDNASAACETCSAI